MRLAPIIERFETPLLEKYGPRLTDDIRRALLAMKHCRDGESLHWLAFCEQCATTLAKPHSCGNRSCPHCQHGSGQDWLQRQTLQLLPVNYYMVTFTLPAQLRTLAFDHQRIVYHAMLSASWQTLAKFGHNDPRLAVDIGASAVLHTHSRRRDYHPHVHLVVPAGGINLKQNIWRAKGGKYLFNARNLAKVFAGKLNAALSADGLILPPTLPKQWIAHCKRVGNGIKTLQYLSRYLYRGVLSEKDIIGCADGKVTFKYINGKTNKTESRTLDGADFLWMLLQHVLPKGFRRSRDFGLLHPRRKILLSMVQLLLNVHIIPHKLEPHKPLCCHECGTPMRIYATRIPFLTAQSIASRAQAARSAAV